MTVRNLIYKHERKISLNYAINLKRHVVLICYDSIDHICLYLGRWGHSVLHVTPEQGHFWLSKK